MKQDERFDQSIEQGITRALQSVTQMIAVLVTFVVYWAFSSMPYLPAIVLVSFLSTWTVVNALRKRFVEQPDAADAAEPYPPPGWFEGARKTEERAWLLARCLAALSIAFMMFGLYVVLRLDGSEHAIWLASSVALISLVGEHRAAQGVRERAREGRMI